MQRVRISKFCVTRLRPYDIVASGLDVIRKLLIVTTGIVGFRVQAHLIAASAGVVPDVNWLGVDVIASVIK